MKKLSKSDFFYVQSDNYDEYIERSIPYYVEMHNEILQLLDKKKQNPKILDLGCGTGKTSYVLLGFYPKATIIAIDLFEVMLNHARKRLVDYSDQVTFVQNDFRSFEWEKGIDLCVSALALHHILPIEKKQLFKKIYNSLNPDGKFIMIDWSKFTGSNMQQKAFDIALAYIKKNVDSDLIVDSWSNHWKNFNLPNTVDEMMEWLRICGFPNVNCIFRYYGLAMIIAEK